MPYLSLLILLALCSLISVLIDRRVSRKGAAQAESTPASSVPPFVERISQLAGQWMQRLGRKAPAANDPVREWLTSAFAENPAEREWFATLTPEQFTLLRSELIVFCTTLGFDLPWLIEQAPLKPANVEQTGKTLVMYYCRALRASVLVQDDLKALQRYQAFLANPTSKENLVFGQQLYGRLVDEKAAPVAPPELLMAGEKERQSFVVQSIETAAKNEVLFSATLKAVTLGNEALNTPSPNLSPAVTTMPTRNGVTASSGA